VECETTESWRKRGDRSPLAATEEKGAPAKIDVRKINVRIDLVSFSRMTRLPCPS
jgi:hypothetical protein